MDDEIKIRPLFENENCRNCQKKPSRERNYTEDFITIRSNVSLLNIVIRLIIGSIFQLESSINFNIELEFFQLQKPFDSRIIF